MEENPFPELKIESSGFLNDIKERSKCPKCGKSRKFYCYTCYVPLGGAEFEQRVPNVKLPLKVDILKHPKETDGKSTAVHAALLAPADVTIYTHPTIPHYDPDKTLLVYPGPNAVEFEEFVKTYRKSPSQTAKSDKDKSIQDEPDAKRQKVTDTSDNKNDTCALFDRVVFIDSTWHYVNHIGKDQRLAGLRRIELKTQKTKFWRHQKGKPETYLATIEAIYYFFREYDKYINNCSESEYQGQYDNLLFYFCFSYQRIRHDYDQGRTLLAYGGTPKPRTNKQEKDVKSGS